MSGSRPFHPVLVASFPVLYLLSQNVDEASVGEALPALGLTVGIALTVWLGLTLLLRDARRGALVTSALVLVVCSYGYAARAAGGLGGGALARPRILLPVWALLAAGVVVAGVRLTRRGVAPATRWFNVAAVVLVVLNVVPVAAARFGGGGAVEEALEGIRTSAAPRSEVRGGPDIYYLVFDRYGGADALEEVFGYDNAPFWEALESRGFSVASESRANYPTTVLSLASSLNMAYLDPLSRAMGPGATDREPLAKLIRDHAVGRFLSSHGYRIAQVGSWWEPTAGSPLADQTFRYGGLSEFAQAYLGTTAAAPVVGRLAGTLDFRRREYERVKFQFDALERSADLPGPTFVFAHILSPHSPLVFDRHGRFAAKETGTRKERYVEQLLYINRRILQLVDRVQRTATGTPPVILLQADEGPFKGPGSWRRATPEDVRRKFSILNAYALPGGPAPATVPEDLSPVNTFRLVFNRYLGTDLPLLPDRSFAPAGVADFYTFLDVTELARTERAT